MPFSNQQRGDLAGFGGQFLGGLFGDSGKPYDKAMDQYQQYAGQAAGYQQPFYQAGTNAIPQYQNWLNSQQDPSAFMNKMMGQYQESPYAKYLQQQSMRAGQNAASANGTMGSTPFAQQMQQNSAGIASGDMNNWLKNVLGINTQYGAGQQAMMQGGQNSANSLSNIYNQLGQNMAEQSYNKETAGQNDMWNTIGGGIGLAAMFL